jgi:CHAD domain-containing protein
MAVTKEKLPLAAGAGAVAVGGAVAATKVVRDRVAERAERRERAYRLQPGEDVAEGIRRIARGQVDLARDELQGRGDTGVSVHEARKAFKRQRALLRLVRDEIGDDVYRRENATYRGLGRALAGARDAEVIAETLDAVVERAGDEIPEGAFAGLREALESEASAAHERLDDDPEVIRRVIAMLETARVRIDAWPLPDGDGTAPLAPGLKRIYRRGRRALRAADAHTDTEHLHELRKRAKDLWHAGQIARPASPKKLRKLSRRAHDLSDVVGEDHDLAVLLDAARARERALAPGEREMLASLVGARRGELQRGALERARKLYARKPRKAGGLVT